MSACDFSMVLSFCGYCRFRHVKRHKSVGKLIFKTLDDIRSRLLLDFPKRGRFTNLIKEIADYALCKDASKHKKNAEEVKKQNS